MNARSSYLTMPRLSFLRSKISLFLWNKSILENRDNSLQVSNVFNRFFMKKIMELHPNIEVKASE